MLGVIPVIILAHAMWGCTFKKPKCALNHSEPPYFVEIKKVCLENMIRAKRSDRH